MRLLEIRSSLPFPSTFAIPVVNPLCLLVSFRLTLRLGLRSVLPRLRGDGDAIDSRRGIASGAVVIVPTTPAAHLYLLRSRLLYLLLDRLLG